jgi:nuclear receptor interaction protein
MLFVLSLSTINYKIVHHISAGDRGIVSCSGDGIVLYTELTTAASTKNQRPSQPVHQHGSDANDANLNYFNCHSSGTTYEVLTVPTEPYSFMRYTKITNY